VSTDYLFRVQHIAPVVLAPRLLDSTKFASSSRSNGLQDGAILGALLSFSLACALAAVVTKWSGFFWPCFLAVCTVFVFGPTMGLTARWLWPDNGQLDRTLSWAASSILAFVTAWMIERLMYRRKFSQTLMHKLLLAMMVGLALMVVVHFNYPLLINLAWHRAVSLVVTLVLLYVVSRHVRPEIPWVKWVEWSLLLVAVISVPRWLRALGWIENADWYELGASLIYMAQCILLFFAMLETARMQQTGTAITLALSPLDDVTGLHTWRVCKEAIARLIQRDNTAAKSSSMVVIHIRGLEQTANAHTTAYTQQMAATLAHRIRAVGEPLDCVGLQGNQLIYWVIERALTPAQLTELGHKIRMANARPYEQLDQAFQPQLTMVCCFNPPPNLSVEQLIDQASTTAELAGRDVQRTMQFMVFP
jgi:GGDEF domain-containing protein